MPASNMNPSTYYRNSTTFNAPESADNSLVSRLRSVSYDAGSGYHWEYYLDNNNQWKRRRKPGKFTTKGLTKQWGFNPWTGRMAQMWGVPRKASSASTSSSRASSGSSGTSSSGSSLKRGQHWEWFQDPRMRTKRSHLRFVTTYRETIWV